MKLFDSIVFGAFVGFLVDYWLGRAKVADPARLIISIVVGVIVAVLVYGSQLAYF